jgi:integrase
MVVDPKVYGTLADIRQVLDRAMKRLNFDPDRRAWLRPTHSLRDTFITRLARNGTPLDRRMKLAGHRDPAMNLAYGEVEPEALRDAIVQTFDREVGT